MALDPRRSAHLALPAVTIDAAGVFGVQDQPLAAGLLGHQRVAAATSALTSPDAEAAALRPWLAAAVLIAVSEHAIHVLDWDDRAGSTTELARFDRSSTGVAIDAYHDARRLTLTDLRTGYRLPLTATVSRLHPYSSGVRSVLARLAPAALPASKYPPA